MIGLALEGGGAKGSYQAGAYMALKKCGIKIDAVVGTSIGSFNGALIASGEEEKLIELWKDATTRELLGIDDEKVKEILKPNLSMQYLKTSFTELYKIFKNRGIDVSNYRALIRNYVDEEKLRKSKIRYGLTTLRVENLQPLDTYIEDIPNGQLHDYIVASSYLPVFKREKLIDNGYYLDGGFYNMSPSNMLENIGCEKIFVINIRAIGIRKPRTNSKAEIIEIKPKKNLGGMLLFNKDNIEENIERGYNDTLRVLKKLDGINYYFTRKSDWYYKRLNHNVDEQLYKAASALLNSDDYRSTVIKALEYVLEKENMNDLTKYKQSDVIELAKKGDENNIVIRYINKLRIW